MNLFRMMRSSYSTLLASIATSTGLSAQSSHTLRPITSIYYHYLTTCIAPQIDLSRDMSGHDLLSFHTLLFLLILQPVRASHEFHHINRFAQPLDLERRQAANTPLTISNRCGETIYPAILTQGGTGPGTGGFQLTAGSSRSLTVSENWQGRVWGRTNCTFNGNAGGRCSTGDCGGVISCTGTVSSLRMSWIVDKG